MGPMRPLFASLLFLLAGCQASFSADDQKAADIGTRNAAELHDECATDDAGTCTAPVVRARSLIIFCAAQHAETTHGTPFDGGPPCPHP
jgi:hypothetical protein